MTSVLIRSPGWEMCIRDRLNDADGAVVSASIAPRFQFVRLVDVPLTQFGGFVLIEAEVCLLYTSIAHPALLSWAIISLPLYMPSLTP